MRRGYVPKCRCFTHHPIFFVAHLLITREFVVTINSSQFSLLQSSNPTPLPLFGILTKTAKSLFFLLEDNYSPKAISVVGETYGVNQVAPLRTPPERQNAITEKRTSTCAIPGRELRRRASHRIASLRFCSSLHVGFSVSNCENVSDISTKFLRFVSDLKMEARSVVLDCCSIPSSNDVRSRQMLEPKTWTNR